MYRSRLCLYYVLHYYTTPSTRAQVVVGKPRCNSAAVSLVSRQELQSEIRFGFLHEFFNWWFCFVWLFLAASRLFCMYKGSFSLCHVLTTKFVNTFWHNFSSFIHTFTEKRIDRPFFSLHFTYLMTNTIEFDKVETSLNNYFVKCAWKCSKVLAKGIKT